MPDEKNVETGALGALLHGILSNPEITKGLREAVRKENGSTSEEGSADASPTDGLGALLSDPALLEKLPQMIAVMKPLLGALPQKAQEIPPNTDSPQCARDTLLLSLKPFLSPRRCEAIDTMLRINRLGSVLGNLK